MWEIRRFVEESLISSVQVEISVTHVDGEKILRISVCI